MAEARQLLGLVGLLLQLDQHERRISSLELRPYQVEAVERIIQRHDLLLALTMGAGKTATAISAVRQLRRDQVVERGAIFALKSTKYQWTREIAKWDPRASFQVVDGDKYQRVAALRRSSQFNYTILHYECLVNDWEEVKKWLEHDFVVADEATYIKGFSAKRSRRAKALARYTPVRVALSGQPVENRPEELFSIMEFVNPEVLGPFPKFDRTFILRDRWGKPRRYRNLPLINSRLGEAMYRKSREDISEWLPDMVELEMPVVLDDETMALHEYIKKDLARAIEAALDAGGGGGFDLAAHYGRSTNLDSKGLMGQVMSRMLAMRMLSSDPRLLMASADDFDTPNISRGSQYASELKAKGVIGKELRSTKLETLLEHIEEILAEDSRHKVVVFSYFKPMLRWIEANLRTMKIPHVKIDGDVPTRQRDEAIVRFNTDPACRVFLSSDAGAYGIDLNQGSHLICYDLPWSAGALNQRVSRIDRTNSAFDQIMIGYMFGQDTIEERMYNMLIQKRAVSRAFIDGVFDVTTGSLSLDLESLREFVEG